MRLFMTVERDALTRQYGNLFASISATGINFESNSDETSRK